MLPPTFDVKGEWWKQQERNRWLAARAVAGARAVVTWRRGGTGNSSRARVAPAPGSPTVACGPTWSRWRRHPPPTPREGHIDEPTPEAVSRSHAAITTPTPHRCDRR